MIARWFLALHNPITPLDSGGGFRLMAADALALALDRGVFGTPAAVGGFPLSILIRSHRRRAVPWT